MKNFLGKLVKPLPGILLSVAIAALAVFLESLLPIHVIGAAVIAMFIGMICNRFFKKTKVFASGLKFTSKKLLKFAIILLGLSLNIRTVLNVGKMSLAVMFFTLLTCFGGGYFIGRALGLNWKLSNLISAGTLMGRALGMSDEAFGLWAGTAVNDTSSVVATAYAFSEAAGDFATMVKLTRTLAIIPTVLVFALIALRLKRKEALAKAEDPAALKANFKFSKIFPWFILGFLAMAAVASVLSIPAEAVALTKKISKFLMVCALAAIGVNTSFADMKKAGVRPMLHGFIISALVVVVALGVEMCMGLV